MIRLIHGFTLNIIIIMKDKPNKKILCISFIADVIIGLYSTEISNPTTQALTPVRNDLIFE